MNFNQLAFSCTAIPNPIVPVSETYTVTEMEDTVIVCFTSVMNSETYMTVIVTRDVSAIGMLISPLWGHTMLLS